VLIFVRFHSSFNFNHWYKGTFGAVWEGMWGSQQVAIKVLKRPADDDEGAEDFRKECETLQTIKHPNLLVFLGAGTSADGSAYMVTEFMNGGSLRAALQNPLKQIGWKLRVRCAQQVTHDSERAILNSEGVHVYPIVILSEVSHFPSLDSSCRPEQLTISDSHHRTTQLPSDRSWHGTLAQALYSTSRP
jgi:hypothetical protein